MLLAYYKILPKWETQCSYPQPHTNNWGRYVCEQYRYNEWLFDNSSSPNGNKPGYGGYGYMWGTGGSPNSRMLKYHEKHGLTGDQSWNASGKWNDAVNDIAAGHPYSLCVWLTGSGHLVLGRGIVENKHSIVVNDPYGNRNTPGYPSYDGEGAIYDWPGYNHGNVNLAYAGSGLPWVVRSRYEIPAPPDSIVDDFHLEQGFYLHTQEPASMANYLDKKPGQYSVTLTMIIGSKEYTIQKENYVEVLPARVGDFSLTSPAIDSTITNLAPVFSWKIPDDLSDNQAYYWKVKAITNQNDTLASNIHYFQVNNANDLPSEFALTYPQDNAVVRSDICNFQWDPSTDNDVQDQITYTLNLWQGEDSAMIYRGYKTLFSDSLADNQIYQWNVMADDGNGGRRISVPVVLSHKYFLHFIINRLLIGK